MDRLTRALEMQQLFSDADFLELYEQGAPDTAAGKALGVSDTSVRKRRMRFGLPANGRGATVTAEGCVANIEMNRACTKRHRETYPELYARYQEDYRKWNRKHPGEPKKLACWLEGRGK